MVVDFVGAKDLVVFTDWSRAEPGIPVKALGKSLGREITGYRRTTHADTDFFKFADRSAPYQFDRATEFTPIFAPLLAVVFIVSCVLMFVKSLVYLCYART